MSGNFVSARLHPKLVLIKPTINKEELILTVPSGESCTIKYKDIIEKPVSKVTLWGQEMKGIDCGDDVAGFLSKLDLLNRSIIFSILSLIYEINLDIFLTKTLV